MSASLFLTGGLLVSPNDARIEHQALQIRILQGLVTLLPDAVLAPAREAFVDGVVLAEALGQVFPGRSGACNPKHRIDEEAVILGIAARFAGLSRQQGLDAGVVFVGDRVAVHEPDVWFKSPVNDLGWTRVPASMNFSFVHTT